MRYTLNMRITRNKPKSSVYESSRLLPPLRDLGGTDTNIAILDRAGLMLGRAAYFGWRQGTTEWWVEEVA